MQLYSLAAASESTWRAAACGAFTARNCAFRVFVLRARIEFRISGMSNCLFHRQQQKRFEPQMHADKASSNGRHGEASSSSPPLVVIPAKAGVPTTAQSVCAALCVHFGEAFVWNTASTPVRTGGGPDTAPSAFICVHLRLQILSAQAAVAWWACMSNTRRMGRVPVTPHTTRPRRQCRHPGPVRLGRAAAWAWQRRTASASCPDSAARRRQSIAWALAAGADRRAVGE
jgi:hypothetical protein